MREAPLLQRWILDVEELGDVLARTSAILDTETEFLIDNTAIVSFGPVNRSVDFETDVEELSSKEVGLIRGEHTSKGRACSKSLEGLGRGKTDACKGDEE